METVPGRVHAPRPAWKHPQMVRASPGAGPNRQPGRRSPNRLRRAPGATTTRVWSALAAMSSSTCSTKVMWPFHGEGDSRFNKSVAKKPAES